MKNINNTNSLKNKLLKNWNNNNNNNNNNNIKFFEK